MANLTKNPLPVPERGTKGMASLRRFVETARPWLDQAHVAIIVCDPEFRMVYMNPFSLNALAGLVQDMRPFNKAARQLRSTRELIGMDTRIFHRHPDLEGLISKKKGNYGKVFRLAPGHQFRGKARAIRDAKGAIVGYIDSWDAMALGPGEKVVNANAAKLYGRQTVNEHPR